MKRIFIRLALMCFCLLIVGLISTNISYAKVDSKSIMGMWLLDEGNGEVAKDSSGNANDGKVVGAKWVDGKFGKGLEFDGKSHVEIAASKTTDDILNGFTYLLWVKPTAPPPNDNTRIIERDWHNPTIQMGAADFYGSIVIGGAQDNSNVRGGVWTMNAWSFVALTFDATNLVLYVDGEKVKEKKLGKPDNKSGALWFASWKDPGWSFIGVLDEVGIFNVPLTIDDITGIMDNGLQKVSAVSDAGKMAVTWGEIKK